MTVSFRGRLDVTEGHGVAVSLGPVGWYEVVGDNGVSAEDLVEHNQSRLLASLFEGWPSQGLEHLAHATGVVVATCGPACGSSLHHLYFLG